jgi:hypothetical protein
MRFNEHSNLEWLISNWVTPKFKKDGQLSKSGLTVDEYANSVLKQVITNLLCDKNFKSLILVVVNK